MIASSKEIDALNITLFNSCINPRNVHHCNYCTKIFVIVVNTCVGRRSVDNKALILFYPILSYLGGECRGCAPPPPPPPPPLKKGGPPPPPPPSEAADHHDHLGPFRSFKFHLKSSLPWCMLHSKPKSTTSSGSMSVQKVDVH